MPFQYTFRSYDVTQFEPEASDLLDARDKQLEYYLNNLGVVDWQYEFSYPGAIATNTSPAVTIRQERSIETVQINVLGSGSAVISLRVNTVAVFTQTITANAGFNVQLILPAGSLLTASVDSISTAGLSNLWVGAY